MSLRFFFFNDTATTEIYPLSLHDALPIFTRLQAGGFGAFGVIVLVHLRLRALPRADVTHLLEGSRAADRKSTRLNSSHLGISYAVFCLKKKNIAAWPTSVSTSCNSTTTRH